MADMQASIVLKLIDRLSPGLRKISKALGKVETRKTSSKAARAARNQARMLKAQERAVAKLDRSHQRLGRFSERAARAQLRLHRAAGKVSREFRRQAPMMANGLRKARNYALAGAGLVAAQAAAATAFIKAHLISPAAQFEKFGAALKSVEGSSQKARKSLDWVSEFAAKTPYELDQVVDAFVKMRAFGLDPVNGLLKTLGDTSSAMGKDLMQAVEAVADAVTGENERLKEFGVKASTNKGKITYAFTDRDGKQQSRSVKAGDRAAIINTLREIFDGKFAGAMEEQAKTWNGITSNLSDQFLRFKLMIMNAGLFDWMKDKLQGILGLVNKMQETGELQVIAERISNALQTSLKAGWEMASVIARVLLQIGSAISYAADAVGGYENLTRVILGLAGLKIASGVAVGLFSVAKGLRKVLIEARSGAALGGPNRKGGGRSAFVAGGAASLGAAYLMMGKETDEEIRKRAIRNRADLEKMWSSAQANVASFIGSLRAVDGKVDAIATSIGRKLARALTGSDVLLGQQLIDQFNKAKPKVMAVITSIRDAAVRIDWSAIGQRIENTITSTSLFQAGVTMMDTLLQGLKARALAVLNWAKSVVARIKGAFSLNLGASAGGGPAAGMGGRGRGPRGRGPTGHRPTGQKPKASKRGGAFNAGDNVMVNEGQPEIIRFGRSGTVSPSLTQALGGGRGPISVTNHITIQGNADRSTVAALVDQLDRRFRSSLHDIETVS